MTNKTHSTVIMEKTGFLKFSMILVKYLSMNEVMNEFP